VSWTFSGDEARPEEEMTDNGSPEAGVKQMFHDDFASTQIEKSTATSLPRASASWIDRMRFVALLLSYIFLF
jgi:hypothetical protein